MSEHHIDEAQVLLLRISSDRKLSLAKYAEVCDEIADLFETSASAAREDIARAERDG